MADMYVDLRKSFYKGYKLLVCHLHVVQEFIRYISRFLDQFYGQIKREVNLERHLVMSCVMMSTKMNFLLRHYELFEHSKTHCIPHKVDCRKMDTLLNSGNRRNETTCTVVTTFPNSSVLLSTCHQTSRKVGVKKILEVNLTNHS